MSRCYLDTNFLYAHLRSPVGEGLPTFAEGLPTFADWRERVLAHVSSDGGAISALVLDELAYRLILAWLRDDGEPDPLSAYRSDAEKAMKAVRTRLSRLWPSVDALLLEVQPTDTAVVEKAQALMSQPGLPPRDAFHAAHALSAACELIASTDSCFDQVRGLRRIAPADRESARSHSAGGPIR